MEKISTNKIKGQPINVEPLKELKIKAIIYLRFLSNGLRDI